jgi:glucokinase
VNLLDPQAVVVGGGLGSTPGRYWDTAVATARQAIWADVSRDLPVLQARTGASAGVIGAALLAADRPDGLARHAH